MTVGTLPFTALLTSSGTSEVLILSPTAFYCEELDTQASLDNDKKGISVRNVSTEWANSLTTQFIIQIWGYMVDRANC